MASFPKNLTFWLFRVREMLRVRRKRRKREIMERSLPGYGKCSARLR